MSYRRWIYFTEKQKTEIWDRWQRGESMSSIGRRFDRSSSSIYPVLARTGGIRPAARRRSHLALTLAEREEISRGLRAELPLRTIALQLQRAPSTISREVSRNGGRACYRAVPSDQAAWDRALRPKPCKLARHREGQAIQSRCSSSCPTCVIMPSPPISYQVAASSSCATSRKPYMASRPPKSSVRASRQNTKKSVANRR